jgi:hypothetical protein
MQFIDYKIWVTQNYLFWDNDGSGTIYLFDPCFFMDQTPNRSQKSLSEACDASYGDVFVFKYDLKKK